LLEKKTAARDCNHRAACLYFNCVPATTGSRRIPQQTLLTLKDDRIGGLGWIGSFACVGIDEFVTHISSSSTAIIGPAPAI